MQQTTMSMIAESQIHFTTYMHKNHLTLTLIQAVSNTTKSVMCDLNHIFFPPTALHVKGRAMDKDADRTIPNAQVEEDDFLLFHQNLSLFVGGSLDEHMANHSSQAHSFPPHQRHNSFKTKS